ncbi:MAG: toll/interleukin-1 receptor domain-containing protein [candidate division NC10 bacterium]|nr:toll/interleukin-1 receptor domain-containing protein [candidate division NC10 bacterium]
MSDFFVSYNRADRSWAEWIAWQLEEGGYSTVLQAWDFRPGSNFVLEMQKAAAQCARTIAVLSPDYLRAEFTQPEWAAAFVKDPQGSLRTLVPVKVRDCPLEGLLPQIVYINLVGLSEPTATETLLSGVRPGRDKPMAPPKYPGAVAHTVLTKPMYPGTESPQAAVATQSLAPSALQQSSPPSKTAPLALFQRVYLFAIDRMFKSRGAAETFAKRYIRNHSDQAFAQFERSFSFAVEKMYMARADAEWFALSWVRDHGDIDFSDFETAYLFAVEKMYKSRSDAEAFAREAIKNQPKT